MCVGGMGVKANREEVSFGGKIVKISLQRWLHDPVNVPKKLDSTHSMGEISQALKTHTHKMHTHTVTHSGI